MKNLHFCFLAALLSIIFAACSNGDNGKVEYIPFKETADGRWGMISTDGKVLFSEEFKNKPTVVRDGRFFVQKESGFWEMYDAAEKPKKIGGEYAHVSGFHNGRAIVAEKGKPVSIIDTDGKVVKLLDKINGKEILGVRTFSSKYAVFATTDSLLGVIDCDGNCVVEPKYCSLNNCGDDKFIGVNMKYSKALEKGDKKKVKISVISTDGKELFEILADKYKNIQGQFVDGKLGVSVEKDGKEIWGIIDDSGKEVVKPSAKIKEIGNIHGDYFTYSNGEGWGLMNVKGETLIRAKYEYLYYDCDDILVAAIKDGESTLFKYVDKDDNQIGDDKYTKATLFSMFDLKHALVKPNDKIYSIIGKDGKQIDGLPDMVEVGTYEGESFIESDFVDFDKLMAGLKLSANGIMGLTFNSTPMDVVKMEVESGTAPGTADHPKGSPYWYDYKSSVSIEKTLENVSTVLSVNFAQNLSRQTYRTQRIIDYTWGDWYWYHDDKIPTGYQWNKIAPSSFALRIDNSGRMFGKMRELLNRLGKKFQSFGKLVKKNNGAAVISVSSERTAFIYMLKDAVVVVYGDLGNPNNINIDEYKDVVEEGESKLVSYGYLNDLFTDDPSANEYAVEDSVAVESAPVDYYD